MSIKQTSNITKFEDQLKLWGAKLNESVAKAKVAGQETKIDSRKQVDELKAKLAAAQLKLDKAKAVGSDKWDSMKDGVEHTWKDLESAFKKFVD